ncbi:MAG: response regulator [Myxococcales bacterium]|nr:response regulator [Myxococcales bacterium]
MFLEDLNLLLVEPSMTQQRILKEQLEPLRLRKIHSVSTIHAAFEHILQHDPNVVLSAMHLPDGKGSELLSQMRANESCASTAFILISSETRFAELEPIRQGGTAAIVTKPCTEDDLRRALMDTLDLMSSDALSLDNYHIEETRCLVVDDSKTARMFISRVLRQLGIEQIVQATDGQEAVDLLAAQFFDLIVTDYNMPNLDGGQLVEYIRTASSQPQVPILMVTSAQQGARMAGVLRAGVTAMFDKPFAIEDVRRTLENIFS